MLLSENVMWHKEKIKVSGIHLLLSRKKPNGLGMEFLQIRPVSELWLNSPAGHIKEFGLHWKSTKELLKDFQQSLFTFVY